MGALEVIWRECSEPLHNYAYALTSSQDEADDMLGDTMVKLARQGWRLRLVRSPRAYLFAAVRNAVTSRARRTRWETPARTNEPSPLQGDHESVAVREAVLALPPEQREVVVLHLWGGLTFEEIGRLTHTSVNTSASRYRYALAKLREMLGEQDDG